MKKLTKHLVCAVALPLSIMAGAAQAAYPEKPVHIVVPYPAGGSTDALARTVGQKLSDIFKQPVVVENRAGASGNIGAGHVAQSTPDGYTLFLGTSTALSVNEHLYKEKLPYNPQKDFAPIVLATMLPSLLVVGPSLDVKNVEELTALLKEKGDTINYASSSNGTPAHLGGELFKQMTGTNARHIPYKGGAPALVDLASGQTDYMLAILPESMPLVKSGKLRALGVTTAERLPAYPDIPTVSEAGVPGYELIGWYAFMAPAGTPQDVLDTLNKAFNQALEDADTRARLEQMGFEVVGGPAEKLAAMMRSESAKWKKVVDDVGITLD